MLNFPQLASSQPGASSVCQTAPTQAVVMDLFDPRHLARSSDPATSKQAAVRVREFGSGQCARILAALRTLHRAGPEQLEAVVGIPAYALRKRLADLQHAGLAQPTDATRETHSGRSERIWELVDPCYFSSDEAHA